LIGADSCICAPGNDAGLSASGNLAQNDVSQKKRTAYRHCFDNQGLRLLLGLMELLDVLEGHIKGRSDLRIKLLDMKLLDPHNYSFQICPVKFRGVPLKGNVSQKLEDGIAAGDKSILRC
jgi:hypothetical protein